MMPIATEIQLEDGRLIHGIADEGYGAIVDVLARARELTVALRAIVGA